MRQSYASLFLPVPILFGLACGGPVAYNVTPIPPPFSVGDGGAINNNGQIVGSGPYYTYSTWSAAAGYQVSPPFSNFFLVEAYSINNLGVAGGELLGIMDASASFRFCLNGFIRAIKSLFSVED
jgi:hypothetical protein